MKTIAVVGYKGRMGSVIFETLSKDFKVIGVDRNTSLNDAYMADLVVDFSVAENSVMVAQWCEQNKKPLIIGVTGFSNEQLSKIRQCSKNIPIMMAGNFSLGIFLMKKMLAQIFDYKFDNINLFEAHHKNKLDRPSGTAVEIANFVKDNFKQNIEIASVRGGEEIGTHKINFYFGSEVLSVEHKAFSRIAFAEGVVVAVNFMLKSKANRLYKFEEI